MTKIRLQFKLLDGLSSHQMVKLDFRRLTMQDAKEEEFYGQWWIPGSEKQAFGRLTVTPNYLQLIILDSNCDTLIDTTNEDIVVPVIHGRDHHYGSITLFNCMTFEGSSFFADLMVDGRNHFNSIEDVKLEALEVVIPVFTNWFNVGSFSVDHVANGFSLHYQKPEKLIVDINESLQLEIDLNCRTPHLSKSYFRGKSLNLDENATIQFVPKDGGSMTIIELQPFVSAIQAFVSFLSEDGCNIEFLRGFESLMDQRNDRYQHGLIIYGLNDYNKFNSDNRSIGRPILEYDRVSTKLGVIINGWINFYQTAPHFVSLMQHDYYHRGKFDENRFLNLARALELFHLEYYNKLILPRDQFRTKFTEILENVPKQYLKEVKQNLSFLNIKKLNERLTELIEDLKKIGIEPDQLFRTSNMADKARYCRNYYTHYNSDDRRKALFGAELEGLTQDCRSLLNALILKKIGVDKDIIAEEFKYYVGRSYYSRFYL